jgi:hypothetical protein
VYNNCNNCATVSVYYIVSNDVSKYMKIIETVTEIICTYICHHLISELCI